MRISDWSSDVCSSDLIRDENSNCYSPSSIERQVQGVDAPHSVGAERGFPGDGFDAAIRPGEGDFNFERLQRSEEHTSELQSLMRISYAVFCLKKKKNKKQTTPHKRNIYRDIIKYKKRN